MRPSTLLRLSLLCLVWGCSATTPGAPLPTDSGTRDGGVDAGDLIPTTDEPQYLDFGLDVPAVFEQTGDGAGDAGAIRAVLDTSVSALVAKIGATGDGRTRKLGFMLVLPPWILEVVFPGKIHTVIAQAAQVALAHNVAFHLTVETHYFWETRPDLWNFFDPNERGFNPANVANVEWASWSNRDAFPFRFIDWGVPQRLGAPHMCYLSSAVQAEVARLGGIVGTSTREALATLADAGHPELFSGITVGSEPSLDNYASVDSFDPAMGQLMSSIGAPKVRLGYCSFTALGYSATNAPMDLAATAALVNQRYIQSWANALADAGVPSDRMYSHVAGSAEGTPVLSFTNAPLSIAFIDSARPGWTSYPWGPLTTNFAPLSTALAAHGSPHWGGTEAAPFDGMKATEPYEYLRRHYALGATVVVMNVGATGSLGGALQSAVYGPEALAAYQRFLTGQ